MTNRFMISVAAAALIAGTGFANAQGMGRDGRRRWWRSCCAAERTFGTRNAARLRPCDE